MFNKKKEMKELVDVLNEFVQRTPFAIPVITPELNAKALKLIEKYKENK